MKRNRVILVGVGLLAAALFFNHESRSQSTAPAVTASGIKVAVKFNGTPPSMGKLKRQADPYCAKTAMTDQEVMVNANGMMKNVVVRIVKGAAPAATPPEAALVLDQNNCMYSPRVVAGVAGQKLLIRNSDPVLHNVHAFEGASTKFNKVQMKGSKDIETTILPGVTKFKCDVHPWMTAYVVGNENSYVCVTGDDGTCILQNVPTGTYTLEAWHEKYGTKTADITVPAGQINADFVFSATP